MWCLPKWEEAGAMGVEVCPTWGGTFRRAVIRDGTVLRCPVTVALGRSMFTAVSVPCKWYSCLDFIWVLCLIQFSSTLRYVYVHRMSQSTAVVWLWYDQCVSVFVNSLHQDGCRVQTVGCLDTELLVWCIYLFSLSTVGISCCASLVWIESRWIQISH